MLKSVLRRSSSSHGCSTDGRRTKSILKVVNFFTFQDDKWSYNFDPKLQELITQLESGLQSVLQKGDQSAYHNAEFSGNIAGERRI